jgi:hypothetical protein
MAFSKLHSISYDASKRGSPDRCDLELTNRLSLIRQFEQSATNPAATNCRTLHPEFLKTILLTYMQSVMAVINPDNPGSLDIPNLSDMQECDILILSHLNAQPMLCNKNRNTLTQLLK